MALFFSSIAYSTEYAKQDTSTSTQLFLWLKKSETPFHNFSFAFQYNVLQNSTILWKENLKGGKAIPEMTTN